MSDGSVQRNILLYFNFFLPLVCTERPDCADSNLPPSPAPVHCSQSRPQTEGFHTSLGEVFLWVFPTHSIVTRDFTKQLNHESKMVWKWGTSEEEKGDRKSRGEDWRQSCGTKNDDRLVWRKAHEWAAGTIPKYQKLLITCKPSGQQNNKWQSNRERCGQTRSSYLTSSFFFDSCGACAN